MKVLNAITQAELSYQFMASNCDDLTLSIFLFLTVRLLI